MEYRRLGGSGCRVSAIGLGTWLTFGGLLDDEAAEGIVRRAFELGIRFIDTADVYAFGKAEEQLGRILAHVPRKDYVLASKVFFPTGPGPNDRGLSRKHVMESCAASLRRLGTDYLDLYQCHRFDAETPLEETVRAFADLIRQGKTLYWGVSCFTAEQIEQTLAVCRALGAPAPVTNQPPYSLLNRKIEAEVVPVCRRHGLGTLAYSPLAQGVLTGKYLGGRRPPDSRAAHARHGRFIEPYLTAENLARVERLAALAQELGLTPARLALAWLLTRDTVSSVLVGARRVEQLEENAAAAETELPDHVLRELDALFPAPAPAE